MTTVLTLAVITLAVIGAVAVTEVAREIGLFVLGLGLLFFLLVAVVLVVRLAAGAVYVIAVGAVA